MCGVWIFGGDRDEGESDVAQSPQDAVKGGLVDDGTSNYGGSVVLEAEGQPVKPRGPSRIEMSNYTDLISRRFLIKGDGAHRGLLFVRVGGVAGS